MAKAIRYIPCLLSLLVGAFCLKLSAASEDSQGHYQGGSITWAANPNQPRNVNITFQLNFRHRYSNGYLHQQCDEEAIETKKVLSTEGSFRVDGERVTWANYVCKDYNQEINWSSGSFTFTHTLAPGQTSIEVTYEECCWLTEIANNGQHVSEGRGWNLASTVDISPRADNSKVNSPPLSLSLPIYRMKKGCPTDLFIPALDSDDDEIKCRWTNRSMGECNRHHGDVCGPLFVDSKRKKVGAQLEEDTCRLSFRVKNPVGVYALSLILEDFAPSDLTTPLSKIPLQFLIEVLSNKGPCRKPLILGGHGMCETIPAGRAKWFTISARSSSPEFEITSFDTIKSRGIVVSPIQRVNGSDSDYYIMLTWTPDIDQIGRHVVCYKAEEDGGFSSDTECIYLNVVDPQQYVPFLVMTSESVPAPGSNVTDREIVIKFNKKVVRPKKPGFVTILDAEDLVIFTADTSESDINGNTLAFNLPIELHLAYSGLYKIRVDSETVKTTRRCEARLPLTEWDFTWMGRRLPARIEAPVRAARLKPPIPGSVDCHGNFMQVFVSKRLSGVIDPNTIYLNDHTCQGMDHNVTHYVIGTSYNMCQTSIKADNELESGLVTYENTAFIPSQPYTSGSEITRNHNIEIHLACRVQESAVNYLSFDPNVTTLVYRDEGYQRYNFSLEVYEDIGYTTPYKSNTFPLKVNLEDAMYFEARLECHSEKECALVIDRCWATPTTNPFDVTRFPFIENGCPQDDTVQLLTSPTSSRKHFSLSSFAFIGEYTIDAPVFVHCEMSVCNVLESESQCETTCDEPAVESGGSSMEIFSTEVNRLVPHPVKRDVPSGKSSRARSHVATRHFRGTRDDGTGANPRRADTPLGFNADVVEITMLGGIMALLIVLVGIQCAKWRNDSEKAKIGV